MTSARRASTPSRSGAGAASEFMRSGVDGLGIFQDRLHGLPASIPVKLEETAVAARVARDGRVVAELRHLEQHDVVVAVQPDLVHLLHVAGLLALEPQLAARAAVVHGAA